MNQNDTEIAAHRANLRARFSEEKDKASHAVERARDLFGEIRTPNPYEKELHQVAALFSTSIENGDDIRLALYALKAAFDYKAFDDNAADAEEVDDLAARLNNYSNMQKFLQYEVEIRTACKYRGIVLESGREFSGAAAAIAAVKAKLGNLKEYIDSDVRLKTELVGSVASTDKETIAAMIREYSLVYSHMHETVLNKVEAARKQIQDMTAGETARSLAALDGIKALRPEIHKALTAKLRQYEDDIFECPSPSRAAVENSLRSNPIHDCGLTFADAEELVTAAENAARSAANALNEAFRQKLEVPLNAGVRELPSKYATTCMNFRWPTCACP